jgi:hypothetical protein
MNVIGNATRANSNTEIVVQSSKRPTPLRRNVVNNITHVIQHESENEVLKDWSYFNFPDMYGDEMDAYEQVDSTTTCEQDANVKIIHSSCQSHCLDIPKIAQTAAHCGLH